MEKKQTFKVQLYIYKMIRYPVQEDFRIKNSIRTGYSNASFQLKQGSYVFLRHFTNSSHLSNYF